MPVINHIWDELSDNILMETDENGAVIASYTNEPSQFGEVVSKHQHGQDYYFHFDGLGSTRNLTDQNQAVTDSYTYTAFGETVASSGSTPNPFQFNGKYGYYTNDETDDIYVRRRTYDPRFARWLSRDPFGFVDGPNAYAYVENLVPNAMDPSGELIITPIENHLNIDCGERAKIRWDFQVEPFAPCDGYFVQQLTISCAVSLCSECPELNPVTYQFYEAFPVEEGEQFIPPRVPGNVTANHTDQASRKAVDGFCGASIDTGIVKFYCKDEDAPNGNGVGTGELGGFGVPGTDPDWTQFGLYGAALCLNTVRGQPSTGDRPGFWNQPAIDGPAARVFAISWSCCDCEDNFAFATGWPL